MHKRSSFAVFLFAALNINICMNTITSVYSASPQAPGKVSPQIKGNGSKAENDEPEGKDYPDYSKLNPKTIIGRFGNREILLDGLIEKLKQLPPQIKRIPFNDVYKEILRGYVDQQIILTKALSEGDDKKERTKKLLEQLAKEVIFFSYLQDEVDKTVKDADVIAKYNSLKEETKNEEEVRLQHVLFSSKEEAEKAFAELMHGKITFEKLIPRTIDSPTKTKNGDTGYIRKSQLPPECLNDISQTEKGHYVPNIVSMGKLGYSIVFMSDRRPLQFPPLEKVKPMVIKFYLKPELEEKFIEELKTKIKVEKFTLEDIKKKSGAKNDAKGDIDPKAVAAKFPDGSVITVGEIKEFITNLPEQYQKAPFADIYEPLLQKLIESKILYQTAVQKGYDKKKDVLEKIAEKNQTAIASIYIRSKLEGKITADMVKEQFNEIKKNIAQEPEIKFSHIVVQTKKEAEDIIAKLNKNRDKFAEFAKKYSLDDQTKANGGNLGYQNRSTVDEKVWKQISEFKTSGVMIPYPIDLPDGKFAVIKIDHRRTQQLPKFEEIEPQLRKKMEQELEKFFINKIREESKPQYFDVYGKPIDLSIKQQPQMQKPQQPQLQKPIQQKKGK